MILFSNVGGSANKSLMPAQTHQHWLSMRILDGRRCLDDYVVSCATTGGSGGSRLRALARRGRLATSVNFFNTPPSYYAITSSRSIKFWISLKIMTLTQNLVPTCRYCLNCTKFGQLILRKIIKIGATRCPILRLKCTKFDFGWGSAPDPAGGAYSAPPDPLAGFKGAYF